MGVSDALPCPCMKWGQGFAYTLFMYAINDSTPKA